ncbi:hypothetical protein G7075_04675 [Phycicoccus sp. HDW14]|uniref:hypothetical protein n=1 Tax=Phycicoccus sp. HDW14 TaxID=2714941 RepID=UPI00140E33FD|nr:hypothetical protein [Phycicoccus sp. HDW14]QIM20606.1 hypothetical protein G7075_04675 [Phycicoccus sp. HDW14]
MRSSFDKLISWTGIIVAAVLLVAGGLLVWASTFATSNVHDQLAAQQITMPVAAALTTDEMKANLTQYEGQEMTTGAQAKAYADYYIQAHMNEQADGKTYSQVSGEYMAALKADPTAQATADLGQLRQTLFMGTTLRGMLLNAYAFATLGTIAMWAAVAAFIGSAVMFVLGALGLAHARKVVHVEAPALEKIPATA